MAAIPEDAAVDGAALLGDASSPDKSKLAAKLSLTKVTAKEKMRSPTARMGTNRDDGAPPSTERSGGLKSPKALQSPKSSKKNGKGSKAKADLRADLEKVAMAASTAPTGGTPPGSADRGMRQAVEMSPPVKAKSKKAKADKPGKGK